MEVSMRTSVRGKDARGMKARGIAQTDRHTDRKAWTDVDEVERPDRDIDAGERTGADREKSAEVGAGNDLSGLESVRAFVGALGDRGHALHALARQTAPKLLRNSLQHFAKVIFPEHCRLNFNRMHRELFRQREEKMGAPPERQGTINLTLAPRGAAKSTLVSLIFPIHAMLHGLDPYIVLVSATQRQAITRLDNIRRALRHNPNLRKYFPAEMKTLERSSRSTIVLNGCRLDAFSVGTEIRGITHGEWRPTWVILDDVESSSRVLNPGYRDHVTNWMREVIENLGDHYTNVDLIGTLLHTDALPVRLSKRPDIGLKTYRSIINECDRPNLWDDWLRLLNDLADPARVTTARAYYAERSYDMQSGSEVLWEEKEDYYALQLQRATRGSIAFNQEKQNEPPTDADSLFPLSSLQRFNPANDPKYVGAKNHRLTFGFLDPALAPSSSSRSRPLTSDYTTIVTVALDLETTEIYVVDVWMERCGPSRTIPQIFELFEKHKYHRFGIETNAFQQLLLEPIETERGRRKKEKLPWQLDIKPVRHTIAKHVRIQQLESFIRRGWIRLAENLPEPFIRQLTEYPRARHDDGPDALAAAVQLARDHVNGSRDQIVTVERIRSCF